MRTLEHVSETARRAHYWTSFSPDKRGEQIVSEYSEEIDSDIETITKQGAQPEQIERYKNAYESKLNAYLVSHSNVASTMIAGRSNFNVRQNEKRNKWADNHYERFRLWREKVLGAYAKYARKQAVIDAGGPLEIAKAKLEALEKNREIEKEANKKIKQALKDMVNIDSYLLELGVKPHMLDWAYKFGFGSCNTNASIRATKARIAELSKKEEKAQEGNKQVIFKGGKIVHNYESDRLQIFHDEKPGQEKIQELKKNGYKWSPFNKCWQRQLTNNALYSLRFLNLEFIN